MSWELGHVTNHVVAFVGRCAAGKWSSMLMFWLLHGILGVVTKAGDMIISQELYDDTFWGGVSIRTS